MKTTVLKKPEIIESDLYCTCFLGSYDASCDCDCTCYGANSEYEGTCTGTSPKCEIDITVVVTAPVNGDMLLTGSSPAIQMA